MNLSRSMRILLAAGWAVSVVSAMPIVTPGIGPGVDYRLIFVTSAAQFQNSNALSGCISQIGGIECSALDSASIIGASQLDNLPQTANATWRLVGSMLNGLTAAQNTDNATLGTVPVYDLQGNLVAPNGLFGAHVRGIIYDEYGNQVTTNTQAFTGSNADGSANAGFEFGNGTTRLGDITASSNAWINNPGQSAGTGSSFRWYIVSNKLTTPPDTPLIPEPSTYVLVATGIAGILYRRYRRS